MNIWLIYFVLFPQASEPCQNFNTSKMDYCWTIPAPLHKRPMQMASLKTQGLLAGMLTILSVISTLEQKEIPENSCCFCCCFCCCCCCCCCWRWGMKNFSDYSSNVEASTVGRQWITSLPFNTSQSIWVGGSILALLFDYRHIKRSDLVLRRGRFSNSDSAGGKDWNS